MEMRFKENLKLKTDIELDILLLNALRKGKKRNTTILIRKEMFNRIKSILQKN